MVIVLVTVLISACGFEIVNTGHRGIKTVWGEVVGDALPEGLHFYNPVSSTIHELDVRTQNFTLKALSYSKDAQIVEVSLEANLNLEPAAAHTIFREVGNDWANKIVAPILKGITKEVIGQYKAVDLISQRNQVTLQIKNALKTKLATKSFLLTNAEISNLNFDDAFEAAVKKKVIAVEMAKESKNKTVRIREEAQQKVIAATAEARSMRIRARALSQNKALVEYEAVQKWNGVMPQYMLGGATPFINLK